jgi:hypothetical protein
MSLVRRLVGIFGILLAVFAGGCGLIFLVSGLSEVAAGRNDYGVSVIGPLLGGVPALIGGLIAWLAFRKPAQGPGDGSEAGAPQPEEDKPA